MNTTVYEYVDQRYGEAAAAPEANQVLACLGMVVCAAALPFEPSMKQHEKQVASAAAYIGAYVTSLSSLVQGCLRKG